MKHTMVCILLCVIAFGLFACASKRGGDMDASFGEVNFNNINSISPELWASDEKLFYCQDGFYNMGAYWNHDGKTVRLFRESELNGEFWEIFPQGRSLYFALRKDWSYSLWRYDLDEQEYAKVCDFPAPYSWAIAGDYFIYQEHRSYNDLKKRPLFIYNMTDGSTQQVCDDTAAFGLVAGELRYITYADGYQLFEYLYEEGSSTLLGSFSCEYGDGEFDAYNFTADKVVMRSRNREYAREFAVYTISADRTAVYTLPKGIHNLTAYDRYAYAVLYGEQTNSSGAVPAKETGIYRIDLSDGSYEVVVENADDQTKIYVESDDRIYIIERKATLLRSRRYVWCLDVSTGEKKDITVI